jgi:hypothetical protein
MSRLLALLVAASVLPWSAPAAAQVVQVERPRHRWDLGVELIGLWGAAARVGWERDQGWLDMAGLRAGWATGPSPVFGSERSIAVAFVAPVVDLFADEEWQLELTFGPARVDVDHRSRASTDLDDWGWVVGGAGRYKTPGWFQINIGVLMLADDRFYERVVVVDIGPAVVW